MPAGLVHLKNGTSEWDATVFDTYRSLVELAKRGETAVLRKVKNGCENPSQPTDLSPEERQLVFEVDRFLLQADGTIGRSARNVILSAIESKGDCSILHSPVLSPLTEFWFL